MLRWRLLIAAAILTPLVILLVLDVRCNFGVPGVWLAPLGWLVTVLAAAEVLDIVRGGGYRPATWSVFVGVSLLFLSGCSQVAWGISGTPYPVDCPLGPLGFPLAALAAGIAIVFVAEMIRFQEPGDVIPKVALALFALVYAGLPLVFAAQLRFLHDNYWGMAALVSLIFVVKMSDTGAYAFGKLFGRHKLSPRLSPGKTIEGALGGIVTAMLSSWLFFALIVPLIVPGEPVGPPWWGALLYGLVVAIAGMVGDLAESLLKRDIQRKDSSRWLPGLGGILDVLDSLLMGAPAAYLCWAAGIVGPLA